MNLQEILDEVRNRDGGGDGQVRVHARQGATIGDGIRTAARFSGWTAVIALMLNYMPMLLAALAGVLFMFRGCVYTGASSVSESPRAIATTLQQPTKVVPTGNYQGMPLHDRRSVSRRTPSRSVSDYRLAESRQAETALPNLPSPQSATRQEDSPSIDASERHVETSRNRSIEASRPANTPAQSTEDMDDDLEVEQIRFVEPEPFSLFGQGGFAGFRHQPLNRGLVDRRGGILGAIGEDRPVQQPAQDGDSPLFQMRRGHKFVGTSQLPGRASERISLTITEIREGGSDVRAKLSLIEGRKITREFQGCIENDLDILRLNPVPSGGGFGVFITGEPWYSNSPTQLMLYTDGSCKVLSGESGAGERFELTLPTKVMSESELRASQPFDGFVDDFESLSRWQLTKRNGQDQASDPATYWVFEKQPGGVNRLTICKGEAVTSSGYFTEYAKEWHIDVVVEVGGKQQEYRGVIHPLSGGSDLMRVILPKNAGAERQTELKARECNYFDLQKVQAAEGSL